MQVLGVLEMRVTEAFPTVKTIYAQCCVSLHEFVYEAFAVAACVECSGTVKQLQQKMKVSLRDMQLFLREKCL